jgi:serine/threonine protein kinase
MKNGGSNLLDYSKKLERETKTAETEEKMERFWIEVHRLILGIREFLKHDSIHHDLKPQNIVYNEKENRLNFIDFGLVQKKRTIIFNARMSTYDFDIYWYYFPFELYYFNYDKFKKLKKLTDAEKEAKLLKDISDYQTSIQINAFLNSFKPETQQKLEKDFPESIIFPDNFSNFLELSIKKIDVYGLGFSMMQVLEKSSQLIDSGLKDDLYNCFYGAFHPNLNKRYDIEHFLTDYESILQKNGLLDKYHYKFENHKLVINNKKRNINRQIMTEFDKILKKPPTTANMDISIPKSPPKRTNKTTKIATHKMDISLPKSSHKSSHKRTNKTMKTSAEKMDRSPI